jgi:hypothetical protein
MAKTTKRTVKGYTASFQFEVIEIHVRAKTKGEARKKAIERLRKKSISALIDRNNSSVERNYHD